MDSKIKKLAESILAQYMDAILADPVFIQFAQDNELTNKDKVDIACCIGGLLTSPVLEHLKVPEKERTDVLDEIVGLSYNAVIKKFDDFDKIVTSILEERCQYWHDKVIPNLTFLSGKTEEPKTPKKTIKLNNTTTKKKTTKKTTKKTSSKDEEDPRQQVYGLFLVTLINIAKREDDVLDLAKKYSEIDEETLIQFLCTDMLVNHYKQLVKSKDTPDNIRDALKYCAQLNKAFFEALGEKVIKSASDYDTFQKEYSEVFQDHYLEFTKKLSKQLAKFVQENKIGQ